MIEKPTQELIQAMHAQEIPIREICRKLKISRNAVRRAIRAGPPSAAQEKEILHEDLALIRHLYTQCNGNVVRVKEKLEENYGQAIPYSSLTRIVREARLRKPKPRVGRYSFAPGEEMQHDTSPHRVRLGTRLVKAQCAALVLAFSRMLFIQYYPRFTRFEAKCFLHQALTFMEGVCGRCVIDNTSVILAAGSGAEAVVAPEMEAFARLYRFTFFAHAIGHADRKARGERAFHYVENNFLVARSFRDWDDLNDQALKWCQEVANAKEKRSLGMSPQAAWLMEKPHLKALPRHSIPIYQAYARVVDTLGYITLETNRYSVPQRLIGKRVEVHKTLQRVRVYSDSRLVADHPRFLDHRDARITAPGHHLPLLHNSLNRSRCVQEQTLRGSHPDLDAYLEALKKRVRGRGVAQFRRLLEFRRAYPPEAFLSAIQHALHYRLFDLSRLERLILQRVAGDFFQLDPQGDDPCV